MIGWTRRIFHLAFMAFMLAPLVVVVLVAFTPQGYLALPVDGFSLRWFWAILDNPQFISSFWVSLKLALLSATLSMLTTLPAAMAIARYRFPGRDMLTALLMAPLMVPAIVLGVALLRFLSSINMASSFTGLVLCHLIIVTPFVLRMALASLAGIDRNIEHAAISLGASRWTAFRRITLPLVIPGLFSGWILAWIHSFDELAVTIFVAAPSTTTLPVRLFNYIEHTVDPLVASVSTVVMLFSALMMYLLNATYGLDRLLAGERR